MVSYSSISVTNQWFDPPFTRQVHCLLVRAQNGELVYTGGTNDAVTCFKLRDLVRIVLPHVTTKSWSFYVTSKLKGIRRELFPGGITNSYQCKNKNYYYYYF